MGLNEDIRWVNSYLEFWLFSQVHLDTWKNAVSEFCEIKVCICLPDLNQEPVLVHGCYLRSQGRPPIPPSKLTGQIPHIGFFSHFNSPSLLDFRFKFRVFLYPAADSPSHLSSLQDLYLIPYINHNPAPESQEQTREERVVGPFLASYFPQTGNPLLLHPLKLPCPSQNLQIYSNIL